MKVRGNYHINFSGHHDSRKKINKQRGCVKRNTTEEVGKKEKRGQFSSGNDNQKNDRMKANEINSSEKLDGVLLSTLFHERRTQGDCMKMKG